jgi:outer membrane PBP1 activator LpoA protein
MLSLHHPRAACYTPAMKSRLALIAVSLVLAGCATKVETRVASGGVEGVNPREYMISTVEQTSPELRVAYRLVAKGLALRGFAIAKDALLHVEVTLDERAASLALAAQDGTLAAAKKKRALQSCADREYRLGITMTQVADGNEVYRARTAEYHCQMSISDALPQLVDAALKDLGKPGGSYAVVRKGRD